MDSPSLLRTRSKGRLSLLTDTGLNATVR
ncbi:hypothetical protein E2C01_085722 [Portunus trituberculatus]|uniref:Uncharacterized protein n=1 Tax=Portunus trituberculatus TaxID=210409 RepID=A0A5B7J7M3_PORTR|nr:hypothetical protein [Portunus trituberculatus]